MSQINSPVPAVQSEYNVEGQITIVFRRLLKNKLATFSFFLLLTIILACVAVPLISGYGYNQNDLTQSYKAPSAQHWLGTDQNGRDELTRLFYGGRMSLLISLSATFIDVLLGLLVGMVAGFYGGRMDNILMRITEIFLSLPFLIICITVIAVFGMPDATNFPWLVAFVNHIGQQNWSIILLVFVLGILSWPSLARMVRGQVLSLREQEFMEACEALGIRDSRRIFRHIMPNVLSTVIVYATLGFAGVILAEAGLSFLGLGVNPVTPTWGNMIQEANSFANIKGRLWLWVPAGAIILLTVMSFNILGDGLRDALDPKMKD
jgi:peptide/nickel transport system permease protein